MLRYLGVLISLVFISCTESAAPVNKEPTSGTIALTNLCDLVDTPSEFIEKTVRIRAALRYGRHILDLYSVRCNDPKNTTVEFRSAVPDQEGRPCTAAGEIQQRESKLMGEATFGVDVQGKLEAAPDPPYNNPFRYKFNADCLNERKAIWFKANGPWALPPEIRQKIEVYEVGQ